MYINGVVFVNMGNSVPSKGYLSLSFILMGSSTPTLASPLLCGNGAYKVTLSDGSWQCRAGSANSTATDCNALKETFGSSACTCGCFFDPDTLTTGAAGPGDCTGVLFSGASCTQTPARGYSSCTPTKCSSGQLTHGTCTPACNATEYTTEYIDNTCNIQDHNIQLIRERVPGNGFVWDITMRSDGVKYDQTFDIAVQFDENVVDGSQVGFGAGGKQLSTSFVRNHYNHHPFKMTFMGNTVEFANYKSSQISSVAQINTSTVNKTDFTHGIIRLRLVDTYRVNGAHSYSVRIYDFEGQNITGSPDFVLEDLRQASSETTDNIWNAATVRRGHCGDDCESDRPMSDNLACGNPCFSKINNEFSGHIGLLPQ